MKHLCYPTALWLFMSSLVSADDHTSPIAPVRSASPPVASQIQEVELPPVDASVLHAGQSAIAMPPATTTAIAPQHIQVKLGINELMPIALGHLNRLVTPFDNPVVTTTSQATTSTKGKIVYIATADETPVTLYITPGDNQDIALSLTLIPKHIPAREIHLTLDNDSYKVLSKLQQQSTVNAKTAAQEQEYITQIKKLFRALGLQKSPAGFSLREPTAAELIQCRHDPLQITTGQILESQDMLLLVGIARNTGISSIEFNERWCATTQADVLAVAAWPKVVLHPGETTELYVAVRRSAEAESALRPSLLNGSRP